MEWQMDKGDNPWLEVLIQGIINQQELCAEFDDFKFQAYGNVPGVPGVSWTMSIVYHRFAVRFVFEQQIMARVNEHANWARDQSLPLASLWLQAQALESKTRLDWTAYTISVRQDGEPLLPGWVDLGVFEGPPSPIAKDDLTNGAKVMLPAVYDLGFRRAIRDYDLALQFEGADRLVFLWRAAEEVLRAHHEPPPDKTPPYGPAAKNLGLFYQGNQDRELWVRELAKPAHRKGRHAGEELGTASMEEIEAAVERVAEMIRRHSRYIDKDADKTWSEPEEDILTGWLGDETA